VSSDIVQVAATYGLIVRDVPQDGNCALHVIIDQLSVLMHPIKETVTELRNKAVTFLRQNSAKLQFEQYLEKKKYKNVDAYLSHQSRNGVWLDEVMMRALTEVLQKDINIYHENGHVTHLAPTVNDPDCSALQVCINVDYIDSI
jgi:OTU-like cysteine protease